MRFSTQALYKIADQTNDPKFYQDLHWSRKFEKSSPKDKSFWGEGRFEFKIDVLIGNTSGLGSVITKYFSGRAMEIISSYMGWYSYAKTEC